MSGYDLALVLTQFQKKASIFTCNDFAVLTTQKYNLGHDECGDVWTWVNAAPPVPMGQFGATTNSFLNTQTFISAWDILMGSGKIWQHDWVVKADPDAVFFPDRLRDHLRPHQGEHTYVLNCQWDSGVKLFGSIEVFPTFAILEYSRRPSVCKNMGWSGWGEDAYMQTCMGALGIASFPDFNLVGDSRCKAAPCTRTDVVAFHPYKDPAQYWSCWGQSNAAAHPVPVAQR